MGNNSSFTQVKTFEVYVSMHVALRNHYHYEASQLHITRHITLLSEPIVCFPYCQYCALILYCEIINN
mgnify:CR=1 FL=1